MKKNSLWISAAAALVVAVALAGCGSTSYFAGRTLPPSGLLNRVLIAVQNSNALYDGELLFVDAFYDVRSSTTGKGSAFLIHGYSGGLPVSIQSFPEEQLGVVYSSKEGSLVPVDYAKEAISGGNVQGLSGLYSSIFMTRDQTFVFAASQANQVFTVLDKANSISVNFSLPGVYRVSVNTSGTAALAFVQNSNFVYYPRKLDAAQITAYAGGPAKWPLGAVDCEPQNEPTWCLFQALDPSSTPSKIVPLTFDRPIKAVFSADGSTAYVLSCGPECGGSQASVTPLPLAPMILSIDQASGRLPTSSALAASSLATPGGASNALVVGTTLYVVGQQPQQVQGQTLFGGKLTVINLNTNSVSAPISISDGEPGLGSRILVADDNTLWIGMSKCTNGVRAATGQPFGCLTMVNTTNNTVSLIEPYQGDATGIAAVTGLHKIYTAEGGQVYIHSTVDGTSLDNQYVTVTGTAIDVAYMDAVNDSNNTVY